MNKIIRALIIIALITNCGLPAGMANTYDKYLTLKACINFMVPSRPDDPVLAEAAHIYHCQSPLGCINQVPMGDGGPNYVKPRDMGTALLGLIEAYFTAGSLAESNTRIHGAISAAAKYLHNRQEADGAWCSQYDETSENLPRPDMNKTPSSAGSVLIAWFRIHETGLETDPPNTPEGSGDPYYDRAKRAAGFIIDSIALKGGSANGLCGAGKEYGYPGGSDDIGQYRWGKWSWISDNCYAYQALRCMQTWATEQGDTSFADDCRRYADGIFAGIHGVMKNGSAPVWKRVVDEYGANISSNTYLVDDLCYYPVKMNVSSGTLVSFTADTGQWMKENLQNTSAVGGISDGNGAFRWGDADPNPVTRRYTADRLSPRYTLQAWLALNNIPGQGARDAQDFARWWWESREGTGGNGQLWDYPAISPWDDWTKGGFVDWFDPDGFGGNTGVTRFLADNNQKFIDTSAYAIMIYSGGFNYDLTMQSESPVLTLYNANGPCVLASDKVFVTSGTVTAGAVVGKDKGSDSTARAALDNSAPVYTGSYSQRQKLTGLKQVNMYYYADGEPTISTASARVPEQAASYNFNFEVPVKLAEHKYFYYCIEVIDSRGFHTFWPSTHRKQFYRVEVKSFVEEQIGMNGGTVSLTSGDPNEGNTSVEIPAGAFTTDETVTIKQVPVDDSIPTGGTLTNNVKPLAVYDFELSPIKTGVFNKPVTMRLHYPVASLNGASESSLRVFWWDNVEWRMIGGELNTATHLVSTKVMHFSRYGVFPTKALSDNDYRPKERIVTPAYSDGFYDFAQFGGVDNIDVINIYDVNGRRIRQIRDALVWDGNDDNGSVVESGLYIYQIKLKDTGKVISGTLAVAK